MHSVLHSTMYVHAYGVVSFLVIFFVVTKCGVVNRLNQPLLPTPSIITPKPVCYATDGTEVPVGSTYSPDCLSSCECKYPAALICIYSECPLAFEKPKCVNPSTRHGECCEACHEGHNCRAPDGTIVQLGSTYRANDHTNCACTYANVGGECELSLDYPTHPFTPPIPFTFAPTNTPPTFTPSPLTPAPPNALG